MLHWLLAYPQTPHFEAGLETYIEFEVEVEVPLPPNSSCRPSSEAVGPDVGPIAEVADARRSASRFCGGVVWCIRGE
jgi:hypothetical protein